MHGGQQLLDSASMQKRYWRLMHRAKEWIKARYRAGRWPKYTCGTPCVTAASRGYLLPAMQQMSYTPAHLDWLRCIRRKVVFVNQRSVLGGGVRCPADHKNHVAGSLSWLLVRFFGGQDALGVARGRYRQRASVSDMLTMTMTVTARAALTHSISCTVSHLTTGGKGTVRHPVFECTSAGVGR